MAIVEYKNINLSFDSKIVLENFSLRINPGEKILISGKSGKGKSTLLRMLLGFQTPDSGQIFIDGKELSDDKIYDFRKYYAYVNQDITIRNGKVNEVLKEISTYKGNNFTGTLSKELLEQFEMNKELLEKKTSELSGGERQRLGIVLAIMLDRPIFLLDEVTSALDVELKEKVVQYFEQTDKTVISISHDPEWSKNGIFRKVVW
jgi:ABC-type bacteriocin/lantibiotic exporter with double-glycine peptidase domain